MHNSSVARKILNNNTISIVKAFIPFQNKLGTTSCQCCFDVQDTVITVTKNEYLKYYICGVFTG